MKQQALWCVLILLFSFYSYSFVKPEHAAQADMSRKGDTLAKVEVKDRSQYSAKFINALKQFSYAKQYKLSGDMVIFGDTAYFPVDLPLNKEITFQSCETYCMILKSSGSITPRSNFVCIIPTQRFRQQYREAE